MLKVYYQPETISKDCTKIDFKKIAENVLQGEGKNSKRIHLIVTDDAFVRDLNKRYRKLDKTTDVLAFPFNEKQFLGEIYISAEQVKRQASHYKTTFTNEMLRVFIHGILHLCGYDHKKEKQRVVMRKKEIAYLKQVDRL
ncbi:rRNA maturation RNase YbeY [Candidatus Margulisiibacteriota bacterium]